MSVSSLQRSVSVRVLERYAAANSLVTSLLPRELLS